jgi:hypothetical protein
MLQNSIACFRQLSFLKKRKYINKVGLEVNSEKTKYMLLSRYQNEDQVHDIKVANRLFEILTFWNNSNKSKLDLGRTKQRLNLGNTCYPSVHNIYKT